MDIIHLMRPWVLPVVSALTAVFAVLTVTSSVLYATPAIIGLVLVGVGIHDLVQSRHSILRNYPLLGHLRFLAEGVGPEIRQYFVESNTGGRPFDRDQRSLMYRRSKDIDAVKAFGTELDVYREGYGFISHSMAPKPIRHDAERAFRVDVGGPECTRPYSSSILNISAMSFGALSGPAIEALNAAARDGGFAHNTGEGGISGYHRRPGGDLIWQIGTGYFGCRTPDGAFDPERFAEQARDGQVKMVEVKVSQGAKPGHGGILPAVKVSPEIAEAREIPVGEACFSPPGHSAFSTPAEMLEFIARLRDLSGGKPAGFKLCVGDPRELFAVCKAMETTGITPDFVSVDGGEGGTGAAPLEYSDHLGMPLREGLVLVNNALARAGVREQVRVGAAGKRVDSFEIASAIALGADLINIGRGFMFSLGCIQAQRCHTNTCPVGITTQNPRMHRALVVADKAPRANSFHRNTVHGLAELTAACGLDHPGEFTTTHLYERIDEHELKRFDELYVVSPKSGPLDADPIGDDPRLGAAWESARIDSFA